MDGHGAMVLFLFTDDIGTAFASHPYLVDAASLDVDPVANRVGPLFRASVPRVRDGQLPLNYEMGGKPTVGVRAVVGIAVVSSALQVREPRVCRRKSRRKHGEEGGGGGGRLIKHHITYGASVQVKTCEKPHDRTSAS
jgi:hypothetical protein